MTGLNAIYRYSTITEKDINKFCRMRQDLILSDEEKLIMWHDETCLLSQICCASIDNAPLYNHDKSLILVCDGVIYNYKELSCSLVTKGYACCTNYSYEVILYLYELYGKKCLDYLHGIFAFCIYDVKTKKMFVARDRIGEKILYYAEIPSGVVISTEIRTILKEYINVPKINITSLLEPMRYIAPLNMEQTWISQIKRLQPGHCAEIDANGFNISQYWKRSREPQLDCSREEAIDTTMALMQKSVDSAMQGDEPIAIMLSGGIDSSAVAALAKIGGHEVHTITVGFGGEVEYDERNIARRFAQEKGFDYNEVILNPEDYIHAFEELSQYIDEPITDSAVIAQWMLYKKMHDIGYKIVLSGMGGDELFYNYAWLNNQANARKLRHQFEEICPINTLEKKKQWYKMMRSHWKALIMPQAWHMTDESTYIPWYHQQYQAFIKDATLEYDGNIFRLQDYSPHQIYPNCQVGKEIEQAYDDAIDRIMVGAYLYLGSKVSGANSIEVRCPLIDYKLVDYVMRLPLEMKGRDKSFMKDVLKEILPDYILYGAKRGFTPSTNYPQMIASQHQYRHIHSSIPYYAVALADQILSRLLK